MNHLSSSTTEKDNQPSPILEDALRWLSEKESDGCLQIVHHSVTYFVHVIQGKIFYATNSLAPFERLERHLRRLSNQNTKLTNEIIKQGRLQFRNDLEYYTQIPSDYQSICWLLEKQYINQQESVTIIRRSTREVFESLINLTNISNRKFIPREDYNFIVLIKLDSISFFQQCQKRIQAWQTYNSQVYSSYQRLYLATQSVQNVGNLTTEQNQTIRKLLKGLNFRQISALIDKDELIVIQLLYPAIVNQSIIIRSPKQPFDQLPRIPNNNPLGNKIEDLDLEKSKIYSCYEKPSEDSDLKWIIACVEHHTDTQQQINNYLSNKGLFSLKIIPESLNAFSIILKLKPDLIFLNTDLPNINGYELCNLLRNHHDFKATPIIMLSNHQSLMNLTKSKLTGATNYLVKPFSQSDLFDMVNKYLT